MEVQNNNCQYTQYISAAIAVYVNGFIMIYFENYAAFLIS